MEKRKRYKIDEPTGLTSLTVCYHVYWSLFKKCKWYSIDVEAGYSDEYWNFEPEEMKKLAQLFRKRTTIKGIIEAVTGLRRQIPASNQRNLDRFLDTHHIKYKYYAWHD